jgi:hypothetical protein
MESKREPKRVIIESPYRGIGTPQDGEIALNLKYLDACLRDSLILHKEAPFASHRLYTLPGVLDDDIPSERMIGIEAGLTWGDAAEATVVYTDRGISRGMQYGIDRARAVGRPVITRSLPEWAPLAVKSLPEALGESS